MHSPTTLAYFCAPSGHLWEWEDVDGNQGVVWSGDSSLIAFRQELHEVLEACVPVGLPPLGCILHVMAAASGNYSSAATRVRLWEAAERATGSKDVPSGIASLWKGVGAGLDQIHALPAELRSAGPARIRLLQTLFEEVTQDLPSKIKPALARNMVDEFVQTPFLNVFQQRSLELNGIARLLADLNLLEKAFTRCPPEHLEERLRTGIDRPPSRQLELPLPQTDEVPVPDVPADLLRALEHEGGELAHVAGLVRRIGAMLHVPKAVTQRDELPLGGVSDITNRGDPSRLLMTELAWDDLTFAVRLAQGEALYLRRESPPAEPPPRRLILIDTGIFMWGRPRLFALGSALALLRQKQGGQTAIGTVFALDAGGFINITLETVPDVRTQLSRLQPVPHPGSALTQLAGSPLSPFQPNEEVFLITHPAALETLGHLPVWRHLSTSVPLHTLLVDRDGHLELSRHSLAGTRLLAQLHVDAEDLFEPSSGHKSKPSSAALTSEAGRLPQFYRQKVWPLYLPGAPMPGKAYQLGGKGYVGISSNNAVCWWTLRVHAGRVLYPTAPSSSLMGVAANPDDDDLVLLLFQGHRENEMQILVVSLSGHEDSHLIIYHGKLREMAQFRVQSGALVLTDRGVSKALSLENGRLIASAPLHHFAGIPWFDGEAFHSHGDRAVLPSLLLTENAAAVRKISKRQRIAEVDQVGFGISGGLFLQKKKGRAYKLEVHQKGGLEWSAVTDLQATFRPLQELYLSDWPDAGLSQAEFPDGRRVIYDPRGFLHVCDSGGDSHQLSLVLVKGHTAVWQRKGFHYGESNLLWGESIGANSVLHSVTKKLFRPSPPAKPVSPSFRTS